MLKNFKNILFLLILSSIIISFPAVKKVFAKSRIERLEDRVNHLEKNYRSLVADNGGCETEPYSGTNGSGLQCKNEYALCTINNPNDGECITRIVRISEWDNGDPFYWYDCRCVPRLPRPSPSPSPPPLCYDFTPDEEGHCPSDADCPDGTVCTAVGDSCICNPVCGNGVIEGAEVCDPPSSTNGCSSGTICNSSCSGCELVGITRPVYN